MRGSFDLFAAVGMACQEGCDDIWALDIDLLAQREQESYPPSTDGWNETTKEIMAFIRAELDQQSETVERTSASKYLDSIEVERKDAVQYEIGRPRPKGTSV